jgi:uncharacterized membrane protein (DUF441 family)
MPVIILIEVGVMKESVRVLFFIMVLGLLAQNRLVTCSAGLLLSLAAGSFIRFTPALQSLLLDIGIILMVLSILIPYATGEITVRQIYTSTFSINGLISTIVGVFAAILGSKGVSFLKESPEVMAGLIFGSILGASFFKGVPTGPLVAAGIAAMLVQLVKWL